MVTMRSVAKDLAWRAGVMSAYHALHNAGSLTVVMFHRVLPAGQIALLKADSHYTVTPQFLEDCVKFLRQNYAVVSLEDVLAAQAAAEPLPVRAALITFDDGWYDNLKYAAPVLRGTPWTVFVAAEAMLHPECWWQEALLWAIRSHAMSIADLWVRAGAAISELPKTAPNDVYALLRKYSSLEPQQRNALLAPQTQVLSSALDPMMLSPADLAVLRSAGASIAAHGASHVPLSLLSQDSLERDLGRSRDLLAEWLGEPIPPAMSIPHGSYNDAVLRAAERTGFRLVFTSDPFLNGCKQASTKGNLLGRIPLDMHDLSDWRGRLDRGRMAGWLFRRQRRKPSKG
jgi:peptidoglycan/xylan/chitin deacetylase (PgdA/CDA1 family)